MDPFTFRTSPTPATAAPLLLDQDMICLVDPNGKVTVRKVSPSLPNNKK